MTTSPPLSGGGTQNREDNPQTRRLIQARMPAPLVVKTIFAMAVVEMGHTGPTSPPHTHTHTHIHTHTQTDIRLELLGLLFKLGEK